MSIIITKFHYSETEAHETEAQIWYYSFLKPFEKIPFDWTRYVLRNRMVSNLSKYGLQTTLDFFNEGICRRGHEIY